MDFKEILCDDIDAVVFGEGSEEFVLRMFKPEPTSFYVNKWGGISQFTHIISTEHLFLHLNFLIIPEKIFHEAIEILKKDTYLGIVTYLLDDIISFEKSGELYDKYIQDSTVPLKHIPGKIGGYSDFIINDDLNLISLWVSHENHQVISAGIKAAICSERKAAMLMKENRDGVLKNLKFITDSDESPFIEERQAILVWMFENYAKKNKKMNINQQIVEEFKNSFKKSSSTCSVV